MLDSAAVRQAMEGCDAVIHLASIAGVDTVLRNPVLTMRVSLLGTMNVLEAAAAKGGIKRVIDFSTSEVFGRYAYNVTEWDATTLGAVGEARWTYAVAKLATEHLAMNYWKQYQLPACSIRPFNIYGPRQVGEGAVHHFIVRALRGEPLQVHNDGSQIRAWCYVDDIVDGITAGAAARAGGRPRLQRRQPAIHAHHLCLGQGDHPAGFQFVPHRVRAMEPGRCRVAHSQHRQSQGAARTSAPASIWRRAFCAPSTGIARPLGFTMSDVVLRADDLAKTFRLGFFRKRVEAVKQASFDVRRGEMFGYLGPNGSGKTTTLKMLMGLVFPSRGHAEVLGRPVPDRQAKRRLGYLPESPYFYEYLTPEEFLDLVGLPLRRAARRAAHPRGPPHHARGSVDHARGRPLRKFSKGMLQRIGIAQALMGDPELVVLDEPMTGLDPIGRKEIRDLMLDLKREGRTVLYSTHILPDVEMTCDRVAMIFAGRIRRRGAAVRAAYRAAAVHRGVPAPRRRPESRRCPRARANAQNPDGMIVDLPEGADVDAFLRAALAAGAQRHSRHAAPRIARGSLRARGQRSRHTTRGRHESHPAPSPGTPSAKRCATRSSTACSSSPC